MLCCFFLLLNNKCTRNKWIFPLSFPLQRHHVICAPYAPYHYKEIFFNSWVSAVCNPLCQPDRWIGGSATTKQLTWLADMKSTERRLCVGYRKVGSNAVYVQDEGWCTPAMAWLLLELRHGAGGGLGVFGWRGQGVYINPSHADGWHLCPPLRTTDQNQARSGELCMCLNPQHIHIGSIHIFHKNGSYILLTIYLPPIHIRGILQVSQSVSVSSNEIAAFILHTLHLSYSKKYFFLFNLTFKPIHFSPSVMWTPPSS